MTRTFWAPGRVNLIGEHTDYSGGLVLPVALDRGIRLTVEPTRGPIELTSADGDVGRYADAMLAELEVLGRPAVNLAGRIESDLPIGAGLSSSAALEVALGLALCAVAEFAIDPLVLAEVAQLAEHRATGVPCGVMDQAVSLLGREGHALLLDTGSLEWELVPLPPELRIVVIDSGVRRQLEHSGYAERRAELERGLAGAVDPVALRRVHHVRSENERVARWSRSSVPILWISFDSVSSFGRVTRACALTSRCRFRSSTSWSIALTRAARSPRA